MFNFRALKIYIGILAVLWIFLGEIASTFPFKRDSGIPIANNHIVPFTHQLNNQLSENESTRAIDSIFGLFFSKKGIKSASISITGKGQLLYAKGFGFANEELGIQTEPRHLFRLASVSKLITAVAVMKLKEDGQLDINEKVFGPEGVLGDSMYLDYNDNRIEDITIQQLLNHTAGWRHEGQDPVFRIREIMGKNSINSWNIRSDDLIRFVLKQGLDYNPGSRYSYSNFGYIVLGRIIEKKSGMEYEDYLKYYIFQPLGIFDMHLGINSNEEQSSNRVLHNNAEQPGYFPVYNRAGTGAMVPNRYRSNILELLGSAGGWIASSPELVRLVCAIDGYSSFPDILSSESIVEMTTPVGRSSHLYGWRGADGYGTWWRTGTLSGSIALVIRFNTEFNWVVLLNISRDKRKNIHNEISQTIYQVMRSMEEWPDYNLFAHSN